MDGGEEVGEEEQRRDKDAGEGQANVPVQLAHDDLECKITSVRHSSGEQVNLSVRLGGHCDKFQSLFLNQFNSPILQRNYKVCLPGGILLGEGEGFPAKVGIGEDGPDPAHGRLLGANALYLGVPIGEDKHLKSRVELLSNLLLLG